LFELEHGFNIIGTLFINLTETVVEKNNSKTHHRRSRNQFLFRWTPPYRSRIFSHSWVSSEINICVQTWL